MPFAGKPRTASGDVIDWCDLHLGPPDPAAPWLPPRTHTAHTHGEAGNGSGAALFFDPCGGSNDAVATLAFRPSDLDAPRTFLSREQVGFNRAADCIDCIDTVAT